MRPSNYYSDESPRGADVTADFPRLPNGNIPMTSPGAAARSRNRGPATSYPMAPNFAAFAQQSAPAPAPVASPALANRTTTQRNMAAGNEFGWSPGFQASIANSRALKQFQGGTYANLRAMGQEDSEKRARMQAYGQTQLAGADLSLMMPREVAQGMGGSTGAPASIMPGYFEGRGLRADENARDNAIVGSSVNAQDTQTGINQGLAGPMIEGGYLQNQRMANLMPAEVQQYANQARAGQLANQRTSQMLPRELQAADQQNQYGNQMLPVQLQQGRANAALTGAQAQAAQMNSPFVAQYHKKLEDENKQLRAQVQQFTLNMQRENAKANYTPAAQLKRMQDEENAAGGTQPAAATAPAAVPSPSPTPQGPAVGATATNPQTGHKIVYNGTAWVAAK